MGLSQTKCARLCRVAPEIHCLWRGAKVHPTRPDQPQCDVRELQTTAAPQTAYLQQVKNVTSSLRSEVSVFFPGFKNAK